MADGTVHEEAAITRLMRLLSVEGITGQEKLIGEEVARSLVELGVPRSAIRLDDANSRISLPTQTGNLIVDLPGTRPGPRRLFVTHLDTVPLAAGAVPVREGGRIQPRGHTALGGDNRTGCGVLVTLVATLLEKKLPHPPLTLLFTVREESGLWGARFVNKVDLGHPVEGFNVDGSRPEEITIGAVGAERWRVEIKGRAAHAGAAPEKGISATVVASLALAEAFRGGWFGKVTRGDAAGTSNVGSFGGKDHRSAGDATNVVTDYVEVTGESRSHDEQFFPRITAAFRDAFHAAANQVKDDQGRTAEVKFEARQDYFPFRLRDQDPVVQHALAGARLTGLNPTVRVTNGGLDANWLVKNGVPTITFGAGQRQVHTVEEFVELSDYLNGCRMAVALATAEW